MFSAYVARGVKAGLVAGLLFGLFVALVANPIVGFADVLGHGETQATGASHAETGVSHHEHDGHDNSVVSTAVTNAVSVLSGVLWGVLLGGVVFGVAYYFLEPAIPGRGGTKSYVLAGVGFVAVSGAPWLVLPPRPPGVEQTLPTDTRILLYGGMMVAGALVCLSSMLVYGRLRRGRGRLAAVVVATLPFAFLAVPVALAPASSIEGSLPPALTTGLVGMTVFGQVLLWTLLAGTHARLRDHSTEQRSLIENVHSDSRTAAD